MVDLSVVYLSYRPGGIDLLGESLRGCTGSWELIVVDDHPGRIGRGVATSYLRDDCGLPLTWHGESKPKIALSRGALANAMNTGAMRCSGSTVLFLHDYTLPPSTLVADWLAAIDRHGPKMMIHGVAIEMSAPKPITDDVKTWADKVVPIPERPWVPAAFELFYLAVPMRFLELINGVDERGDHCGPTILNALTMQARLLGYDFIVDERLVLKMIDHRVWEEDKDAFDGLWKIKGHASTEAEPLWRVPSKNQWRFSHA